MDHGQNNMESSVEFLRDVLRRTIPGRSLVRNFFKMGHLVKWPLLYQNFFLSFIYFLYVGFVPVLSVPSKWGHLVSGDFHFFFHADPATRTLWITRGSQTTDHPLFWPCPIPSTRVILSSTVSGIKRHRSHPPKALLLCTLFGAPSLAKAPACEVQQCRSKARACKG